MKYLCDPHVIPTVVPRDAAHIASVAAAVAPYSAWLHVDVNDGVFDAEVNWPYADGIDATLPLFNREDLPKTLSLEAHLMVVSPRELGVALAGYGFERIAIHREAFGDDAECVRALGAIRAAGADEVGIALKIETPLASLRGVIAQADFIHLMSIAEIGAQGQPFDERSLSRVEEVHAAYPDIMVAVDGGITEATVEELVRAGANRLLVGHALAESGEPEKLYARLLERAMRGCGAVESSTQTLDA